jgi:hypothetical protein
VTSFTVSETLNLKEFYRFTIAFINEGIKKYENITNLQINSKKEFSVVSVILCCFFCFRRSLYFYVLNIFIVFLVCFFAHYINYYFTDSAAFIATVFLESLY